MKNKRKYIIIMVGCLFTFVIMSIFLKDKKNTFLLGEWTIDSFMIENEVHPFSEFGQYWGEANQRPMSYYSISFKNNNTALFVIPTWDGNNTKEVGCTYEILNNIITLINNEESVEAFKIVNDTLQGLEAIPIEGTIWRKNP